KELESKTEQALNCLGLKPENSESSLPDYLKNKANLEKSIKSIYKQCLSVHPLHNSFSFFVSSFQNTPKGYLKRVYSLAEDIDKTAKILGAEPLLDIDDDQWVPYTYREDDLGSALSNMISVVENGFTKIIAYGPNPFEFLFKNVEDPNKGFREYADEKLNEIDWSFPDYVSKFDSNPRYNKASWYGRKYKADGEKFVKYKSQSSTGNVRTRECKISVPRVLSDLTPALFLNKLQLEVDSWIKIMER
ncbi:hypothetical protein AKJ49_00315, partial [candidate division MSBL1 archaeon SCGC-AAA382A03]